MSQDNKLLRQVDSTKFTKKKKKVDSTKIQKGVDGVSDIFFVSL